MKLLHLSDLHIGKTLNGVSLQEQQRALVQTLLELCKKRAPDAVLVAGDIFDRTLPGEDAVRLADSFFAGIAALHIPVLAVPGNHDSAARVGYLSQLARTAGLYFPPVLDRDFHAPEIVTLRDGCGPVNVYLLPFVRPAAARSAFPEAKIETYRDAVAAALAAAPPDAAARNVLVAHQLVLAGQVPPEKGGSEEMLVGGVENVDAALFDVFDYVALGHIHRAQNVKGPRIRYCGAPLKYAKDEALQEKSVTLVTLGEKGELSVEAVPISPLHELFSLRGTLEELLAAPYPASGGPEDFYFITLTDERVPAAPQEKLRVRYPTILSLEFERPADAAASAENAVRTCEGKTMETLFGEFFALRNGRPMCEAEASALAEILQRKGEKVQ